MGWHQLFTYGRSFWRATAKSWSTVELVPAVDIVQADGKKHLNRTYQLTYTTAHEPGSADRHDRIIFMTRAARLVESLDDRTQ